MKLKLKIEWRIIKDSDHCTSPKTTYYFYPQVGIPLIFCHIWIYLYGIYDVRERYSTLKKAQKAIDNYRNYKAREKERKQNKQIIYKAIES